MTSTKITVDVHESKSSVPDLLISFKANVDIRKLPTADYIIGSDIGIERKTIPDFISSLANRRLFNQCDRLMNTYRYPVLLVEGEISQLTRLNVDPMIFYDAIAEISITFRIPMMHTVNDVHTAKLLNLIAMHRNNYKKNDTN